MPAMRLLWTIMTPLGLPVEPLVYMMTARSAGLGFTISRFTAREVPLRWDKVVIQPIASSMFRNST